jgi:type IX secretion system PorP/SprF family membrane protein
VIFLAWTAAASAQQIQQFTQFQFAGISFNPAFAGSDQYFNALAIHRTQWTGINDAPRTYLMGLHAPSKSGKMGFGGNIYTDVAGPTRRVGAQGAYAYHIQVTEGTKLSLGLSFGLTQFVLDGSQITLREGGDRALTGAMMSELKPDANFGVLWYSDKFRLGLSANQILNNELDLFPGDGESRMAVHYFLTGAYTFDIGADFQLEPAVLVKYVDPINPQTDVSLRAIYKKKLWLGGSYRAGDAAAAYAGYQILDYLSLGYSMDFSTSDIKNYADGTHEIFVGIRFGKKQMVEGENTPPTGNL